jgi:hypothetical protein
LNPAIEQEVSRSVVPYIDEDHAVKDRPYCAANPEPPDGTDALCVGEDSLVVQRGQQENSQIVKTASPAGNVLDESSPAQHHIVARPESCSHRCGTMSIDERVSRADGVGILIWFIDREHGLTLNTGKLILHGREDELIAEIAKAIIAQDKDSGHLAPG